MNRYIKNSIEIKNVDNLEAYPIPNLEETLERYLEWAQTLVDEEEYENAKTTVSEFLASKDSKKLHDKLTELGNRPDDSWIYDYWVKCHLDVRAPLSPSTNVPIVYKNQSIEKYSHLEQIAIIIYSVSKAYVDYRKNGPRKYTLNNKDYSSDQFVGLLASINHIKDQVDEYYINEEISEFVIFTYKNNLYKVQTIKNDEVMPISEIHGALVEIVESENEVTIPNANYVTIGVDRDEAGLTLLELLKDELNKESYEEIKKSIFVFNLDEIESNSIKENLDHASYDPNIVNRWHGKGLQFSSSKNGVFSFIADHCYVDGGTELLMVNRLKEVIENTEFDFEGNEKLSIYKKLEFNISSRISKTLLEFKNEFDDFMDSFKTEVVDFNGLSREKLKELGVRSGDGFIHLAFQAAQYQTFGEIYNTYISVDARKYFRGRTECNRPVSKESVEFAKSLFADEMTNSQICGLLHDGLNEHHKRIKLCQAGKGVNRYLFVLESIYKDYKDELNIMNKPRLFNTKTYEIMGTNRLSTTSFTHENMEYLYFPPAVDDGFGIYYLVDDKSFAIITAFNDHHDQLKEFNKNLELSIEKMLEKLEISSLKK